MELLQDTVNSPRRQILLTPPVYGQERRGSEWTSAPCPVAVAAEPWDDPDLSTRLSCCPTSVLAVLSPGGTGK